MDDPPGLVTKGLVLFPKYKVLVLLFLRFHGCDDYGRSSWTNIINLVLVSCPIVLVLSTPLSFSSTINYLLKDYSGNVPRKLTGGSIL